MKKETNPIQMSIQSFFLVWKKQKKFANFNEIFNTFTKIDYQNVLSHASYLYDTNLLCLHFFTVAHENQF